MLTKTLIINSGVFTPAPTHVVSLLVFLHPHPGDMDFSKTNLKLKPLPQNGTRTQLNGCHGRRLLEVEGSL